MHCPQCPEQTGRPTALSEDGWGLEGPDPVGLLISR